MKKTDLDRIEKKAFCSLSIACDAAPLNPKRRESGVCGRCDEAQKKKAKSIPPRGMNTALQNFKKPQEY
jgi:hypothetical protein